MRNGSTSSAPSATKRSKPEMTVYIPLYSRGRVNRYNLFERQRIEVEYLPMYRDYGLGLTTWSPLASGVLTGESSLVTDTNCAILILGPTYQRKILQGQRSRGLPLRDQRICMAERPETKKLCLAGQLLRSLLSLVTLLTA